MLIEPVLGPREGKSYDGSGVDDSLTLSRGWESQCRDHATRGFSTTQAAFCQNAFISVTPEIVFTRTLGFLGRS